MVIIGSGAIIDVSRDGKSAKVRRRSRTLNVEEAGESDETV